MEKKQESFGLRYYCPQLINISIYSRKTY